MQRLKATNEPSVDEAIAALKAEQLRLLPAHLEAVSMAAIRGFVDELDGRGKAVDWLYRRFGESRVEAAASKIIDEITRSILE